MKFLVINYVSQFVKWSGILFRVTMLIDLVFILLVRLECESMHFFLLSVLYFMGMDDLQDNRWRGGTIFIFLHDFQLILNMDLFLCNYAFEITTSNFWSQNMYLWRSFKCLRMFGIFGEYLVEVFSIIFFNFFQCEGYSLEFR